MRVMSSEAALPISVVVPTCRRPQLLDRCLAALAAQSLTRKHYEVLVVDDAREAAVRSKVAEWRRTGLQVTYLSVRCGKGPALARNLGWRAARGAIIAFTDDDCIPVRTWLEQIVAAWRPGIAGGWGRIIVPRSGTLSDPAREVTNPERCAFVTANYFCSRTVLTRLGGFDERFQAAWREDSDLFFTLLKTGLRPVHVPSAIVIHPVPPAAWGVSLGQQRKSMFNALLYKKHPLLYRERIEAKPPLRYYAMVVCMLLACICLVERRFSLAAVHFSAWLLLLISLIRHRLRSITLNPGNLLELVVTSIAIPPLSVFWRLYGALKFRVVFG